MFAGLPPSSSDLAERKCVVPHLLLQIGGANIANPPLSSPLAEENASARSVYIARSAR
jgi:hypothetical protein